MKKLLLSIAVVAFAANLFAQGTYKVTGSEATILASVELGFGIANLTAMHSDDGVNVPVGVVGKADAHTQTGAAITFNGVTFDNQGIIQGSNNGMFFAFLPTKDGILDIASKIGANKPLYILEVSGYTSLTTLTEENRTSSSIQVSGLTAASNPSVTSSMTGTTATWNGTSINTTAGTNLYTILSFAVSANKIYAVGVTGSKYMLRGVNFQVTSGISNTKNNAQIVSTEYYSVTGAKLVKPIQGSLNIVKHKMSDGSVVSTKVYLDK